MPLLHTTGSCECRIISTTGFRRSSNARDTGGQLTLGMGINGEIWSFSTPVSINDLVILCTDGLMDNVRSSGLYSPSYRLHCMCVCVQRQNVLMMGHRYIVSLCSPIISGLCLTRPHLLGWCPSDVSILLPIVMRCKKFDNPPDEGCPSVVGQNASLPRTDDVLRYAGYASVEDFDDVPLPKPAVAARRLTHYTQWVTMALTELENRYYGVELQVFGHQRPLIYHGPRLVSLCPQWSVCSQRKKLCACVCVYIILEASLLSAATSLV